MVVCFCRLLKCLRSLYGKSVDPDQTAPIGAVCFGSTLFASIYNSSVMLSNYLQLTISADDIFRCNFFFALYRLRAKKGPAPPPPRNFADISNLKENFKPHLLRDVCTLCSGALVSDSLLHMLL